MHKNTMEQNVLKKGKQRFRVQGLPDVIIITRDNIEVNTGAIELPDATKVAGGRVEAGEFNITLQFGDDYARNAYLGWLNQAVDRGRWQNTTGVDPDYKRTAVVEFLRAFEGTSSYNNASGNPREPVMAVLRGVWCMSYTIPDFDMDSADGDAFTTLECTLSYDNAEVEMSGEMLSGTPSNQRLGDGAEEGYNQGQDQNLGTLWSTARDVAGGGIF